jgi:hypothetical protein
MMSVSGEGLTRRWENAGGLHGMLRQGRQQGLTRALGLAGPCSHGSLGWLVVETYRSGDMPISRHRGLRRLEIYFATAINVELTSF